MYPVEVPVGGTSITCQNGVQPSLIDIILQDRSLPLLPILRVLISLPGENLRIAFMAAADSTPAMPAPHGQHSQLINPPSKNYPVITCLVLAVVLSAIAVTVRIYTRHRITRKLWWDDCEAHRCNYVAAYFCMLMPLQGLVSWDGYFL